MFWQANKWGVIALVAGLSVVVGLHFYYLQQDEKLAEQILSIGICAVLFTVGLATYLSTRR